MRLKHRFALTRIRPRTLAALSAGLTMLALPAAAGAVTLTGSGSSAAQPYMLELFKGYSKIHKRVHFKYIPDGGNAGVKDVQAGRSQFSINTRPPAAERRPHDLREAVPRWPVHRGQQVQRDQQRLAG